MKAILMSIRPQHLVNILNGKKTIELRKSFPNDYRGWVYCYCTKAIKGKPALIRSAFRHAYKLDTCYVDGYEINLSGKVVARVWVDNVDVGTKLSDGSGYVYLPQKSLWLTNEEIMQYANNSPSLTVIYLSKLEIFDKPKELGGFYFYKKRLIDCGMDCPPYFDEVKCQVRKAPQSWQYIYIEEED